MVPPRPACIAGRGNRSDFAREKPQRTIVSSGLVALDFVIDYDGTLLSKAVGGSAGNVLSILGLLGWGTVPLVGLGLDRAGDDILAELMSLGADLRFVRRSGEIVTPIIYQHELIGDPGKTHAFSFNCPSCGEGARPAISYLSEDLLLEVSAAVQPAVMYIDRPNVEVIALAEEFRRRGALIVFEPSSVGRDPGLFKRALSCADIIKYSDDRLSQLDGCDLSEKIEICTMGSRGLKFRHPSNYAWEHMNAIRLPFLKDTSGAGDWCTAGLIYHLFSQGDAGQCGFLDSSRLKESLAFGQVFSAMNCMTAGARGLASVLEANAILYTASSMLDAVYNSKSDNLNYAVSNFSMLLNQRKSLMSDGGTGFSLCCGPFL